MSQLLINDYLKQLDLIKKVSGSARETIVREAFKDLLKAWGKVEKLTFIAEYPLKTAHKTNIAVDGALLHELRMPLGYWEAKDANDKLDEEISNKLKRGYPQDNIIFSDDVTAVLMQNKLQVLRCDMSDTRALAQLLKLFFSYERAEIADFRTAVAQFKIDLPTVLVGLRSMIDTQARDNEAFRTAAETFLVQAQEAINPSLTQTDVREMLIQHILTEEIFSKVFDSEFHRENNVAKELYALESVFFTGSLKKQTLKSLEAYYAAIRAAAAQITNHAEKQTFLKVIYENFYKVYNAKAADKLGVVYTPNEIVRFMIDGADWLCETHFGKNLIDKDVEILDPATGTGTFICELLEHFRGQPAKLKHKYKHELHANEVAILPYYVANLNIEATYAAITGEYDEFTNLCFVDTLDNIGLHTRSKGVTSELFGSLSQENVARIKRQNSKKISVVIGNPPYNANQLNENDNNKNREYPSIDERIKQTYIAESTAQKTKLYDMYARFFRWASDRLGDDGILAFITNRSFIESRTFDGFRKTIAQEFSDIYVVDLGGDVRANPKLSGTKNNVFGIQTGVAISFMVKRTNKSSLKSDNKIFYYRRPEMELADEKLKFASSQVLRGLQLERITPDKNHNWLHITDNDFNNFIPLASKTTKQLNTNSADNAIFKKYSIGQATNRDDWVYDFNKKSLLRKMKYFILSYKNQRINEEYNISIKWSRNLKRSHANGHKEKISPSNIRESIYRPFVKMFLYDSTLYIDERGATDTVFPSADAKNIVIAMNSTNTVLWNCVAINKPIDLNAFYGGSRSFSLYRYDTSGNRADNITHWALKQFKAHYPSSIKISKKAIFYYCYAVLHNPAYRDKYAVNLKREFPRIPFYSDFAQWATWGEELASMHTEYEAVRAFAFTQTTIINEQVRACGLSPKPILKSDAKEGRISIDSETTLSGIPTAAWNYLLGNRCAIDWVLDQYKEKKTKDSTVREQFDTYRFADYKTQVIDLLARVVTVSLETLKITDAMRQTGTHQAP